MLDPATAVTKGSTTVISALIKSISGFIGELGEKEIVKIQASLEVEFRKYLDRNLRKYSKVKTLLSPTSPVSVENAFVSPNISSEGAQLNESEFLELCENQNYIVVTGLGGSGKSMLLRHLFIRFYNEGRDRIPVMVELRNKPHDKSIKDYIYSMMHIVNPNLSIAIFDAAAERGKFAFLFDGFDEVGSPIAF